MHEYPVIKPDATWPVIATRIRALLTAKRLTGAALGKMLGVGKTTVSGWISGRRRPTANNAYLLALLGGKPEMEYRYEPRSEIGERPRGVRLAVMRIEIFLRDNPRCECPNAVQSSGGGTGTVSGVSGTGVDPGSQGKPSGFTQDSPPA